MEDSLQLQNPPTLIPTETAAYFPPYRRRPLRSRTYGALVGILSHYGNTSPQLQSQVDADDFEVKTASEQNGPTIRNEVSSTDVLVPLPNSKMFEDTVIVQQTSIGENKEIVGDKQATVPELDQINLESYDKQEVVPVNKVSGSIPVAENWMDDCAIQIAKEQDSSNTVLDFQVHGSGMLEEFEVDKEFSIHEFSEVLDSCFGMDMVVDLSKEGKDTQDNGNVLEKNIPKEAEHELQLKEMELEKLLDNLGAVDPSCSQSADDDIEEGEISGEDGVADDLFEHAIPLEDRTKEMVYGSENAFEKEEFICDNEDKGRWRHGISDPSVVSVVNSDGNSMEMESITTAGRMKDFHSQNVFHDSHTETQISGLPAPCLENVGPSGKILQENATENQISASTEEDVNANKKKRKNGPLTKEKRAKKKKKERLKRAEKNRKLGVKRLKLQPILKPKKIVFCRHYLQGRCHEGEKCKFSHDTVPLTKSKPCGHFARHSCMKGDDCPFDHQLSKYPCKNYTENGFCHRGSDCLFSHEMPATQSSSVTPNASKSELTFAQHRVPDKGESVATLKVARPEMKFPYCLNNSNTSKHTHGMLHHKVDSKFCSAGNSSGTSVELPATNPAPMTARQTPRGVTFLLNGGMPLGNTKTPKQDVHSMKTTDSVDVSCKSILKVPGSHNKSNEMSESFAPRKPRGINFLSFAQPYLSDSNYGTGKSDIDNMSEGKQTCLVVEAGGNLSVNRQMNQSIQDLIKKVNGTPVAVSQFLSIDKTLLLDDSAIKDRANLHFDKGDSASSFLKERQSTPSKLQDIMKPPSTLFSGHSDQSIGQYANFSSSVKTSFLANGPSLVQKAVQSTLAFAAKLEPDIKVGSSLNQQGS